MKKLKLLLLFSILAEPLSKVWAAAAPIEQNHYVNPPVTNGLSNPYQSGESTFIIRGVRCIFSFLFQANRNAASYLRLFCLLIWVNMPLQHAFNFKMENVHIKNCDIFSLLLYGGV